MKILKAALFVAAVLALAIPSTYSLPLSEAEIKKARDKVYPATVRVDVRSIEFAEGQKRWRSGTGSGFIIDQEGHVVTNHHVAGEAQEITCVMYNKERVKAKLVGGDAWTDLAVLKLDLAELKRKYPEFVVTQWGDSDKVEEGDAVIAVGAPFGLSRTVTAGIISCRDRMLSPDLRVGGLESGRFNTWLQTDAQLNPGNSGGPLVNMAGEVIGVNSRAGSGLGFAVPANVAKEVVAQIIKHGRMMRSDIGIELQPLVDLEGLAGVDLSAGVVIASVAAESVADMAGMRPRDILLEFDGQKITGRYPEDLFNIRNMIANTPVGKTVKVVFRRGNRDLTATLKTEELTAVKSDEVEFKEWGLVLQPITDRMARKRNFPHNKGVFVSSVRTGLPASRARMQDEDVIISIHDKAVEDMEQFRQLYQESLTAANDLILVRVRRGNAIHPLVVKKGATP